MNAGGDGGPPTRPWALRALEWAGCRVDDEPADDKHKSTLHR
jgi:hypothetical protein